MIDMRDDYVQHAYAECEAIARLCIARGCPERIVEFLAGRYDAADAQRMLGASADPALEMTRREREVIINGAVVAPAPLADPWADVRQANAERLAAMGARR